MTIKQLKDKYTKRKRTINAMLFDRFPDMDSATIQGLINERNCLETFLADLSDVESDNVAKKVKEQ